MTSSDISTLKKWAAWTLDSVYVRNAEDKDAAKAAMSLVESHERLRGLVEEVLLYTDIEHWPNLEAKLRQALKGSSDE